MKPRALRDRWNAMRDGFSSTAIAAGSLARALWLWTSGSPKTPLRVLCIVAFDTLHALRNAKRLPAPRLKTLAALLDLAACANAAFDRKEWRRRECRIAIARLEEAGIRSTLVEYLRRLRDLEKQRPLPGGDDGRFQAARMYREAVVRLSLAMVAATAQNAWRLDDAIRETCDDPGFDLLFRIAMQCQIIDDVLDFAKDLSAGLPSFLTACSSLPRAYELTRLAAIGYAQIRDVPRTANDFPLRAALCLVSTCATLAIRMGRWRRWTHGKPAAEQNWARTPYRGPCRTDAVTTTVQAVDVG